MGGLTPVRAASTGLPTLVCLGGGFSLAGCAAPLTINPAPNFTLFNEYDQSFSHEINFISTWANPLQYIGGLYWYHEHWNQPVQAGVEPAQAQMAHPDFSNLLGAACPAAGPLAFAAICAAPFNPTFAASTENTEINYNSYAVYGQVSYKFNDNWKVSGAIRYTNDHKKGWQSWRLVVFDGAGSGTAVLVNHLGAEHPGVRHHVAALRPHRLRTAFPGAGPAHIQASTRLCPAHAAPDQRSADRRGRHRLDARSQPTLAYGKYSRGYKSGGWSTYTLGATAVRPEPEYVDAFERGAKKTIGQNLTLNADVFYYNYYNEQMPLTVS